MSGRGQSGCCPQAARYHGEGDMGIESDNLAAALVALLLAGAACTARSEPPAPAQPRPTPGGGGDPVAAPAEACLLAWDALDDAAPAVLPLAVWPPAALPDDCPEAFDASLLLSDPDACAALSCARAPMAGLDAALVVDGPVGSGRYSALGLAIADGATIRFVCVTASTVGWRHLHEVASALAPLPWLADLDGDGSAEMVVWGRLPFGHSEVENGLVPAVYSLERDRLIRRDRAGASVARRVADAYRVLQSGGDPTAPFLCYAALARALDRWGLRR
jgi:hypothetical protein